MPRVNFIPSGLWVDVPIGTSLFQAATQAGLPVAASCSAEFVCGKCNFTVVEGLQNLSKQTQRERRLLRQQSRPETDRISCRTSVRGDCTVTTSYW